VVELRKCCCTYDFLAEHMRWNRIALKLLLEVHPGQQEMLSHSVVAKQEALGPFMVTMQQILVTA
jgi:hypothetical protein